MENILRENKDIFVHNLNLLALMKFYFDIDISNDIEE